MMMGLPAAAALGGLCLLAACGKSGDASAQKQAPSAGAPAPAEQAAYDQAPAGKMPAYGSTKFNVPIGELDAVRLCIGSIGSGQVVDSGHFPHISRFQDPRLTVKVPSPDGRWTVWRAVDKDGYWLFLSNGHGKPTRLNECKNGYQPVWSPDSKRILYSAMDWRLEERNLFIYDLASRASKRAYNADHKMGPLAAWSPDGKKIAYTYLDNLWVMNATGIGRGLLDLSGHIHKSVGDAAVIGFSRDGEHIVYQARGDATVYVVDLAQRL
jgi:hypothetical protein